MLQRVDLMYTVHCGEMASLKSILAKVKDKDQIIIVKKQIYFTWALLIQV